MPIDYKKYPKDWPEIRARILERADNKCELCFAENHSSVFRDNTGEYFYTTNLPGEEFFYSDKGKVKAIKIILAVAHLDHNINNNEDHNLLALCQRCHNKIDLPNRIKNRRRKHAEK